MADVINNALSTKYYWRDWLVVVYKEMRGNINHYWEGVCSPSVEYLHWNNNYNVLVSSVDKTKAEIHDSLRVSTYRSRREVLDLFRMSPYKSRMSPYRSRSGKKRRKRVYNTHRIYNNLPAQVKSCRYMIKGVVKKDGNFEIRAPSRRKNYFKLRFYHVFALG